MTDFSIPLSRVPFFSDRWLNGTAGLRVAAANGVLFVTAETVTLNGKDLPEALMKELRTRNLAEESMKDDGFASIMRKVRSIEVSDGRVRVVGGG